MKTKFISNLKQLLFIALAFLGTFAGYSQSPQNPSIGGSKTPSTDPFGDFLLNIGGAQGPKDTGSGLLVLSLYSKSNCIFGFPLETGGGKGTTGGDTGQINDPNCNPYNIGGGKSSDGGLGSLLGFYEIGGKGSTGGGRGTSSGTGQFDDDSDPYDIGGRGGRGTGTSTGGELASTVDIGGKNTNGTGTDIGSGQFDDDSDPYDIGGRGSTGTGAVELLSYEIGGKNTPTDLGPGHRGTDPFDDSDYDTGGRGTDIRSGDFAALTLEYIPGQGCVFETGGRNGTGTSTSGDRNDDDDTGGRNSSGGVGENFPTEMWVSSIN